MNSNTTAPAMDAVPRQSRCSSKDSHWWLFCLVILALNFLQLPLDPLPKLFLGDSATYLWTAISGLVPDDRSFLYGYVIRWASLGTESLNSLLILQAFLGAITAMSVALICRWIFALPFSLSYLFGFLCALDPLQLVWQRYVMTETVSLFFYVLVLLFSFLYLKKRGLWQLVAVQVMALLVISFRMSYLIVVEISAFLLPIIAFFPEIRAALWKSSPAAPRMLVARLAGLHLVISILLMVLLQHGYQQLNGWLAGREPAYLHTSGLTLMATWAPALAPADSPDPRLAGLIAQGDQLHLNDVSVRNAQLYVPGYLIDLWKNIEQNAAIRNQIAKQTALRALFHHPTSVLKLGVKTFLDYWNYPLMRKRKKTDLQTMYPWNRQLIKWAARFHVSPPRPEDVKRYTLLQRYHLVAQPYYYVVLLCPFVCGWLLFLQPKAYSFLLFLHSWLLLGTITLLTMAPNTRYLQPMSLLTILIFAALVRHMIDRRSGSKGAVGP